MTTPRPDAERVADVWGEKSRWAMNVSYSIQAIGEIPARGHLCDRVRHLPED